MARGGCPLLAYLRQGPVLRGGKVRGRTNDPRCGRGRESFADRISEKARVCAGVFLQQERIAILLRGVYLSIKSFLRFKFETFDAQTDSQRLQSAHRLSEMPIVPYWLRNPGGRPESIHWKPTTRTYACLYVDEQVPHGGQCCLGNGSRSSNTHPIVVSRDGAHIYLRYDPGRRPGPSTNAHIQG